MCRRTECVHGVLVPGDVKFQYGERSGVSRIIKGVSDMEREQMIKNHKDYVEALQKSVEIAYDNMQLLKTSSESLIKEFVANGFTRQQADKEIATLLKEGSDKWIQSLQQVEKASAELQVLLATIE